MFKVHYYFIIFVQWIIKFVWILNNMGYLYSIRDLDAVYVPYLSHMYMCGIIEWIT